MIVLRDPLPLLATLLIIILGKSVAAFAIVRMFGYPTSHALTDVGEPRPDRRVLLHPGRPGRRASRCCRSADAT